MIKINTNLKWRLSRKIIINRKEIEDEGEESRRY